MVKPAIHPYFLASLYGRYNPPAIIPIHLSTKVGSMATMLIPKNSFASPMIGVRNVLPTLPPTPSLYFG